MANATKTQVDSTKNKMVGASADDVPDFDKWTDLQIGFAPYWHPKVGGWIFGQLIGKDSRDPEFVRYQFKALKDTECRRGPSNENEGEGPTGESVLVKKGETFSMSVYYSLADEFDYHLFYASKTGNAVPVRIEAIKKVPTKKYVVWNFRAQVSPDTAQQLNQNRDEWRRLKSDDEGTRQQLAD